MTIRSTSSTRSVWTAEDYSITIVRPTEGSDARRLVHRVTNRHGTAMRTRPLQIVDGSGRTIAWANAWALPLRSSSITEIRCQNVLENVRDDVDAIAEFARVLQPGGRLLLRVPSAGPLTGLDSYNLHRYLVDTTRRGRRAPEVDELGWRRHYGIDELTNLLGPDRFRVEQRRTVGLGLAEMTNLGAMALFRWLRLDEDRYCGARAIVEAVRRAESKLPAGSNGFWLEVVATRLPDRPVSAPESRAMDTGRSVVSR